MNLKEKEKNTLLFFKYKNLLKDNKKIFLNDYLIEDINIEEIAEKQGISKQAVSESLKKSFQLLENFEEKLNLIEKSQKRLNEYEKMRKKLEDSNSLNVKQLLKSLKILELSEEE